MLVANSEAATLAALRDAREHILAICVPLGEADWHRPTALPDWDIQDVVAHLGSIEALLLGRAEPERATPVPDWPHVRNPLGAMNQAMVERRRSWSVAEVLAEFRETSALRLVELEALGEAELDRLVPSPTGGEVVQRRFVGIRLWDYAIHEMDIGDAMRLPVRTSSPAMVQLLDGLLLLFPRAFATGGAPDQSTGRLDLPADGDEPARAAGVRMDGTRARPAEVAAGEATLHLRASPATFLRVASGRRDPAAEIAAGAVAVAGDRRLAAAVLGRFNVIP